MLGAVAVSALTAAAMQPAHAAPAAHDGASSGQATAASHRPDNRPGPLTEQRQAKHRAALEKIAKRQATPNNDGVVELGDGKFAEVQTTRQDKIFTILAHFGSQSVNKYGTAAGPAHNEIPRPDRSKDNSTVWAADFNPAYYENLFNGSGESIKNFYEDLSNGRYSVTNTVAGWVQVPYNASYYGDNAIEDFGGSWAFIQGHRERVVPGAARGGQDPG